MYKRILSQSLKQVGLEAPNTDGSRHPSASVHGGQERLPHTPHLVPPRSAGEEHSIPDNASQRSIQVAGLTEEENISLVRQVAEMAATAATVAARDATRAPRKAHNVILTPARSSHRGPPTRAGTFHDDNEEAAPGEGVTHNTGGGHDAPNWSRTKSAVILLGATLLYAIIAEILVNTVDVVLESVDIDEKFLGITLFALVPNTTEFLVSHDQESDLRNTNVLIERYLIRNEWKHCFVNGDRFCVCITSLSTANSCASTFQRCSWTIH